MHSETTLSQPDSKDLEGSSALAKLKEYIISEYIPQVASSYSAAQFRYFHHFKTTQPRLTKKMIKEGITEVDPITKDSIRISIKLVDRDMNGLLTKSLVFEDNELTNACKNKLQTIDGDELDLLFYEALPEILQTIKNDYIDIISEHTDKLSSLTDYAKQEGIQLSGNVSFIPKEFKKDASVSKSKQESKSIKVKHERSEPKQVFDM